MMDISLTRKISVVEIEKGFEPAIKNLLMTSIQKYVGESMSTNTIKQLKRDVLYRLKSLKGFNSEIPVRVYLCKKSMKSIHVSLTGCPAEDGCVPPFENEV